MVEFLDYELVTQNISERCGGKVAYILRKKGIDRFYLLRNVKDPTMLFAISATGRLDVPNVAKVKGFTWFKEERVGILKGVS